jgi:hypothetical protein
MWRAIYERMSRLHADMRLTPSAAKLLLLRMIRSGDHWDDYLRGKPDKDMVATLLAEGFDWHRVIAGLRDNFHYVVPRFENLIDSSMDGFTISFSPGLSVVNSRMIHGMEIDKRPLESGDVIRVPASAHFKRAVAARDAAISTGRIDEVIDMVSHGFSALDAVLNLEKFRYDNATPSAGTRLNDKATLKERIVDWIPAMTGGNVIGLDRGGWEQTLRLKGFRDDRAIHPKPNLPPIGKRDLAKVINDFRGLVGLITTIDHVFGRPSPTFMIRAENFPDVTVVDDPKGD